MLYKHMDYIPFDVKNPNCLHVMLSNRAYSSIIAETLAHGGNETGGPILGHIIGRKWFVTDVIDPGTDTIHEVGLFQWEQNYVDQKIARTRELYRYQPTILGFWHRHPGSMDFFSQQDVESTQKNLQGASKGLISMLVNIDPALRMTFYYCNGPHFMPVGYDVGDEYFPVELLEYAGPELLAKRHGEAMGRAPIRVSYKRMLQPPHAPGMEPRKSIKADNDVPPTPWNVPAPEPTPEPTPEPEPAPPVSGPAEPAPPVEEPPVQEPLPEQTVQEEPYAVEPVEESPAEPEEASPAEPAEDTAAEPAEAEDADPKKFGIMDFIASIVSKNKKEEE